MADEVSDRLRQQVAERAYRVCEYCLIHEDDTFWGCQIDRIISRKHGGPTTSENLAFPCACCNNSKGTDLGTLVGLRRELTRLFHPRVDRWAECFQLHGVMVDSASDIGEATVRLLQINAENRLRERQVLAEVARYPSIEALARMKE